MPVYIEKIASPTKSFWTATSADSKAGVAAKAKFTASQWKALDESTRTAIIAGLSKSKGQVEPTIEMIGEMTGFITDATEQSNAVFAARKVAVQELLSAPDATVETVDQIKTLISPVSYKTLDQWLEGVRVADAITNYIRTEATEASARNEATKAAAKS